MQNYNIENVSIWLTEPKAIILASISIAIIFLILLYFIVSTILQKQDKKGASINKIVLYLFRPTWTIWVALIFSLIIGGIFWGLDAKNHIIFNPNDLNPFGDRLWAWQAIEFLTAIGSWIVIFILFSLWLAIPIISLVSVQNIINEKKDINFHIKRLVWILIFTLITIAISNIMWVFPMNTHGTSLDVFKINSDYQDQFYRSAKWVYVNILQSAWYAWAFIGFSLFGLILSYIVIKTNNNKNYSIYNQIYKVFDKKIVVSQNRFDANIKVSYKLLTKPFQFFNTFGSVEMFVFIVAYSLFNMNTLWIHVATILLLSLVGYIVISLVTYVYGLIKYKDAKNEYSKLFLWNLINSIKPFLFLKTKDIKPEEIKDQNIQRTYSNNLNTCSLNISLNIVVPISFTVFLAFNNHPLYQTILTVGTNKYDSYMYGWMVWTTLIFGSFMLNFNTVGIDKSGAYGKNIVGASTYSIAPGLQTGVLGDLSSTLNHFAKWTDINLKLIF